MIRGNRAIGSIRTLLLIANIFGLIASIVGVGGLIYAMVKIIPNLENSNEIEDPAFSLMFANIICTIAAFFLTVSVFFCSYIIGFVMRADDYTILNNRFILAVFSISVGGFFTPIILAQMRNIPVSSSISPKFTISRGYGGCALSAGVVALAIYLGLSMHWSNQFQLASEETAAFILLSNQIMYSILGITIFWGLINTLTFAMPGSYSAWDARNGLYKFMNILAVINMVIASVILAIMWIYTVLSIIAIILELFDRRQSAVSMIFNMLTFTWRIAMQFFILYTIGRIIKNLWSKEDKIEYNSYVRLEEKQAEVDAARRV